MILRTLTAAVLAAALPAVAVGLPDLGDVSQATFTPHLERRIGDRIMRDIRAHSKFYDDVEAADYVSALGDRLVARSTDTRQKFDFFLIRDGQINAFALPGGYIGVNTGLLLAAQSESEVASVMAHEIAHVTQRHIARMIAQQDNNQLLSIAALAVAILASRTSGDAAQAAVAFGTAGAAQSQLNFTRDNEREADRVGLQILEAAGFDPRAMPSFFERLQRATRVYEGGAPSYLRTHPLTFERIADVQNRVEVIPYRQVPDGLDFQLVRAKLKATLDPLREARTFFEEGLAERKFLSETASRYGLTRTLLRQRDLPGAQREYAGLRKTAPATPMIATLGCEIEAAAGRNDAAAQCYTTALREYPHHRALTYGQIDLLLDQRKATAALTIIEDRMRFSTEDHRLYQRQSRAYALLGRNAAQHRALAEAHYRVGNLPGAIEQLQIAAKTNDGDFYEMSAIEARLRELRRLDAENRKDREKVGR